VLWLTPRRAKVRAAITAPTRRTPAASGRERLGVLFCRSGTLPR
jgi:hypothetical protein